MSQKSLSVLEKIEKLEERKTELLEKRKQELIEIITKCNAIAIDNRLLASFLKFAMEKENKDHHVLKEFIEAAKNNKIPFEHQSQN